MLKIEKFVTPSVDQWEIIIEGTRNPKNSWGLMDSTWCADIEDCETCNYRAKCKHYAGDNICADVPYVIGPNDYKLLTSLAAGGPVHGKYKRMIPVYVTLTAPLYWWKEFDTYKVGTVANSCSTMHKIHAKEFTLEDFSHEHLMVLGETADFSECPLYANDRFDPKLLLELIIKGLNFYRKKHLEAKAKPMKEESKRADLVKKYWWQMIQLLPSSYNQKRTVLLNYEVLTNIYHSRKNHKLDEWHVFCDWIRELPYSELIIGEEQQ